MMKVKYSHLQPSASIWMSGGESQNQDGDGWAVAVTILIRDPAHHAYG